MSKVKYSTKEMAEKLEVSGAMLTNWRNGYSIKSKDKKKAWSVPAMLTAGIDYECVVENGRAKYYYFESALEILKRIKDINISVLSREESTELQRKRAAEIDSEIDDGINYLPGAD